MDTSSFKKAVRRRNQSETKVLLLKFRRNETFIEASFENGLDFREPQSHGMAWVGLAMDLFCVHFLSDLITLLICFEYTQDMSLVLEVRLGHVFTEHAPHIPRPLQFYIRMCL